MTGRRRGLMLLFLAAFAVGCRPGGPVDIDTTADSCTRCRMAIDRVDHAAELLTASGELRRYDSLGCLVADVREERAAGRKPQAAWVVDYRSHGWLTADDAFFALARLQTDHMGYGVAALRSADEARRLVDGDVTRVVRWESLLDGAGERLE